MTSLFQRLFGRKERHDQLASSGSPQNDPVVGAELLKNRGNEYLSRGEYAEAVALYLDAIRLNPLYAEAYNNLGMACLEQDRYVEAERYLAQALALKPSLVEAHYNRGLVLIEQGKLDDAFACLHQVILLKPDYAEAYDNLGTVCRVQGKLEEAIGFIRQALALKPDYANGHNNLGIVFKDQGRFDVAAEYYNKAISLKPDYDDAHYNHGMLLLQMGDLRNGWAKHEYRWRTKNYSMRQNPFPQPRWQGENLQDKTILVWGEQGVGDELRYASFMPDMPRLAGHSIFECEPRLVKLFARSFPAVEVIPRSDPSHPRTTGKDIIVQSPAASLGRWLRPDLESFPIHNGYLVADPDQVTHWQERLAALGPGLKVGISWRSSLMTGSRARSHNRIEQWEPIFRVPGVTFINLFYGECREELEQVERQFGIRIHRWDDLDLKNDLDEVAALTMTLDLVISSPSAVADMPGALGKPVWMMDMSHAHWDSLGQNYSPWYPSMKLFYGKWNEDWTRIIDTVARELRLESGKG